MTILYVLNSLLFVVLSFIPVIYYSRYFKLGFINPISLTFLIFIPVTLMKTFIGPLFVLKNGLFNEWFNFALLMTNLSLLFSFLLILATIRLIERNSFFRYRLINIVKPFKIKRIRIILVSIFFLILFIITFILLTKNFGLINWILNPRTGYQLHRVGSGHWYALSLLFLSTSYTLSLLYSKNILSSIIIFLVYTTIVYFFGSKGFILSYAIFFLIILWFKKSKYFKVLLFVVPPIGFGLMLFNFNPSEFADIAKYFDYYINSAMYYEAYYKGEIDLFYGYLWLTDFYQYLPRTIFEDKPFVYGFLHINEHFFPGAAEATNTPAFGGPIAEFADFGIFGVILMSFFNISTFLQTILFYKLYDNMDFQTIKRNSNLLYLFIWLLAPSFLVFFGTIYMIILFILIIKIISIFNRIKYENNL
jgi:hypothetical protein